VQKAIIFGRAKLEMIHTYASLRYRTPARLKLLEVGEKRYLRIEKCTWDLKVFAYWTGEREIDHLAGGV